MSQKGTTDTEGFELGAPALVCRWRLANRRLPLENRHLRALLARTVKGVQLSKELVAWAKQHIEWTLDSGATDHPCGVLMLIVDEQGRAAMTVGPYQPLEDAGWSDLAHRAAKAAEEAASSGVAPEVVWVAREGALVYDQVGTATSGATSLVLQLAGTLGLDVEPQRGLAAAVLQGEASFDELFLASDEHGVVCATDAAGPLGRRMAEGYQRLLDRTH